MEVAFLFGYTDQKEGENKSKADYVPGEKD